MRTHANSLTATLLLASACDENGACIRGGSVFPEVLEGHLSFYSFRGQRSYRGLCPKGPLQAHFPPFTFITLFAPARPCIPPHPKISFRSPRSGTRNPRGSSTFKETMAYTASSTYGGFPSCTRICNPAFRPHLAISPIFCKGGGGLQPEPLWAHVAVLTRPQSQFRASPPLPPFFGRGHARTRF